MEKIIHIINAGLVYTEEYDHVMRWDSSGRIIKQEQINYRRYWSKDCKAVEAE